MARLHWCRRGLSQVVSTLILLVAAVLLTSVVTYYATNITMTRTRQEEVQITKQHIWVNSTCAVAAFKVQNVGGRDILIDKIAVRSVEEPWSSVYYHRPPSGTAISGDMNVTSAARLTGTSATIDGRTYNQSSVDISLASSDEILIYVKNLRNISLNDVGIACSITVFSVSGQYIVDCMVEYATP